MKYPYISICRKNVYRRHKTGVLLTSNQGSSLSGDGGMPNAMVMRNLWQEHRLVVGDLNRTRHFWLEEINREQFLTLNNAQNTLFL